MENARTKAAVSMTLLALGGLTGVAIASSSGGSDSEPAAATKPKVRTEVVHRTIRHTRTADPAGQSGSAAPSVYGGYSSPEAPVYVAPASTGSADAVNSSSGSGYESDDDEAEYEDHDSDESHEYEHESEDEHEYEGGDDD